MAPGQGEAWTDTVAHGESYTHAHHERVKRKDGACGRVSLALQSTLTPLLPLPRWVTLNKLFHVAFLCHHERELRTSFHT